MSAVSTSKEFFHIASEGSISVLDFIFSQHFQTLISWFQLASEGTNFNALAFKMVSAVPTSKALSQKAAEGTI